MSYRASIPALICLVGCLMVAGSPSTAGAQVIEDVTLPAIASFSLSPGAVDVTSAGRNVTVSMRLTDDLSGVWYSCFAFRSPTLQQVRSNCINDPYDLVSGTNLDGLWSKDLTFPQFSEAGDWRVYYVLLADHVGNQRYFYEQDLIDLGFPTVIQVTTTPDSTPPSIAGFSFSPSSIDVSSGAQSVTLTQRLTDDLVGVWYSCFALRSPTFKQVRSNCINDPYDLGSGTNLDGTWSKNIDFPQFSESGEWRVYYVLVADHVGNQKYFYEAEIASLGFQTTVQIVSVPDDVTAPAIRGIDYAPRALNTSAGPGDIKFTFALTDAPAGVWYACFAFRSPSFQQVQGNCINDPYDLESGTRFDGTYTKNLHFPQFSEAGEWHVYYVLVADNVGNQHYYYEAELAGLGFPTTLQIRATDPDTTAPDLAVTVSPDSLWTPNHALVTITASIAVTDAVDPNPAIELVSITSNEPDNGLGDGDTAGDIQGATFGTDDRTFQLRAERSGAGAGRTYTITYRATDAAGNSTMTTATVTVPKSRAKR